MPSLGQALMSKAENIRAAKSSPPSQTESPTQSSGDRTPDQLDEAFEKAVFERGVTFDHNLANGVGQTPAELARIRTVDRSFKGATFGEGVRFRSNVGNFCLNLPEIPALPCAESVVPLGPVVGAQISPALAATAEERVSPALGAAKAPCGGR